MNKQFTQEFITSWSASTGTLNILDALYEYVNSTERHHFNIDELCAHISYVILDDYLSCIRGNDTEGNHVQRKMELT